MDSISLAADFHAAVPRPKLVSTVHGRSLPCSSAFFRAPTAASSSGRRSQFMHFRRPDALSFASNGSTSSIPTREGIYTVGDFMTGKEHLHVVKPTTTVDEALDILVEKRITGFPVIDDDWKLPLDPKELHLNLHLKMKWTVHNQKQYGEIVILREREIKGLN